MLSPAEPDLGERVAKCYLFLKIKCIGLLMTCKFTLGVRTRVFRSWLFSGPINSFQ